jgi:hypothetical protein
MTNTGINNNTNNKIDKEQLSDRFFRYEMSRKLGLIQIYAYHCARCNFTWLPKNFDGSRTLDSWGNCDLFLREPPKSCARCKSKYWKKEYMQRRRNKAVITDQYKRIKQAASKKRFESLMRDVTLKNIVKAMVIKPEITDGFMEVLEEQYPAEIITEIKATLEGIKHGQITDIG